MFTAFGEISAAKKILIAIKFFPKSKKDKMKREVKVLKTLKGS